MGTSQAIQIARLQAADRDEWQALFRGYLDFYETTFTAARYDQAWEEFLAGTRMHAFGAKIDGVLVGITHFLVHANTTAADVCYLEDLFTAPAARGRGVGAALIQAVVDWARPRGCSRVYWMTQQSNITARRLYDRVAENRGFIRYQIDL
jgi:GNAT superfamily N-acetyltransferase